MKNSHNKYQWQEDLIKGLKKGQLHVFAMARGTGKSKIAEKIAHNKAMLDDLLGEKAKWSDWKKSFTVIPRRCQFTGEWTIGHVCKRSRVKYIPWNDPKGKVRETQYASMKEVFKKILDGTLDGNQKRR